MKLEKTVQLAVKMVTYKIKYAHMHVLLVSPGVFHSVVHFQFIFCWKLSLLFLVGMEQARVRLHCKVLLTIAICCTDLKILSILTFIFGLYMLKAF